MTYRRASSRACAPSTVLAGFSCSTRPLGGASLRPERRGTGTSWPSCGTWTEPNQAGSVGRGERQLVELVEHLD
jgi:hypothetical protein